MPEVFRTPEELLEGLPDFPFGSRYREYDGLRLAHLDEGEGAPVVFFHGEPTWSFLWRKVIPPVRDAGFRCIAPDLPGFGRSDKPTERRLVHLRPPRRGDGRRWWRSSICATRPWSCTTGADRSGCGWRSSIPARIARIVALDTGLFTGHQRMNDAWMAFRDFVAAHRGPAGRAAGPPRLQDRSRGRGDRRLRGAVPDAESKAGARAFPLILPTSPSMPGAQAGQRVLDALRVDARPKLCMWADSDPVLPLATGRQFAAALGGGEIDHVIADAGHFLQEDAGPRIGALIADWLASVG